MSKQEMRDEAERLVREALERKNIVVKQGKTRIDAKCRKCGAPMRISAKSGRGSRGFYLQGVRREASDALIGNCGLKCQATVTLSYKITSRLTHALAVEMRHLRRVVAGAGREFGRDCRIDACEIGGGEFEIEGVERLFELIAPRARPSPAGYRRRASAPRRARAAPGLRLSRCRSDGALRPAANSVRRCLAGNAACARCGDRLCCRQAAIGRSAVRARARRKR